MGIDIRVISSLFNTNLLEYLWRIAQCSWQKK